MPVTRRLALLPIATACFCFGQGAEKPPERSTLEELKVYTEHPRLLLPQARLRLLRKECERKSARWQQFESLVKGKAAFPEPGFALALYYQITGDEAAGKQAIVWASGATDTRQIAIVFDWCQALLTEAQSRKLVEKLRGDLLRPHDNTLSTIRGRVFAAIAVADEDTPLAEKELDWAIHQWWGNIAAPALKSGALRFGPAEIYSLYELLHATRDNTGVDLRQQAGAFFKSLPEWKMLNYYPATYPSSENDFHIPAFSGGAAPDLRAATLSRMAELEMVAYDTNSTETQFLQGWLMHDRFIVRTGFGAPYEFLWANPYQPGLSFFHLPLHFYDATAGGFYVRSSWEEDATWAGYVDRKLQLFRGGELKTVSLKALTKPLVIGEVAILLGSEEMALNRTPDSPSAYYLLGLKPKQAYFIEADDERLDEAVADAGGILQLNLERKGTYAVRVYQASR